MLLTEKDIGFPVTYSAFKSSLNNSVFLCSDENTDPEDKDLQDLLHDYFEVPF